MSVSVIPFENATLPSTVAGLFQVERLGSLPSSSFPVISIKGKVFHKVQGDSRELITKPGEDEPASSIEVVIIGRNPHRSKVFYATGYTEGSDAKPTCYSNNGIQPESDAEQPQSKKCATCAHNQWGSRVTENGGKGKACADSQRLAVAPVGLVTDPMLIRVPAASLKTLDQYSESLVKRNVPYQLVVTKIGFDYSVAHPALTFKGVGVVDEKTAMQIAEVAKSDVIQQIVGILPIEHEEAPAPANNAPAALQEAPEIATPKPAPAPKAEPKVASAFAATAEPEPAPAPVAAAPKAEPKPAVVVEAPASGLESEIADVMAGLDFDD
jgi:hypothetical protein